MMDLEPGSLNKTSNELIEERKEERVTSQLLITRGHYFWFRLVSLQTPNRK